MPPVNDLFSVTTPIDDSGAFSLISLEGAEGISRLFHFRLELVSSNLAVAASDLVGKGITFSIAQGQGGDRYFHGIVRHLAVGGLLDSARTYIVELVPWLWFLTRTANCCIFQNLSTVNIVEKIFGDLGFSDYQSKLTATYPKRVYCVQYRESAFQFISRLLEEEGIYYYFSHADGKHTMILADDASGYVTCPESSVVYIPIEPREQPSDRIMGWQHTLRVPFGEVHADGLQLRATDKQPALDDLDHRLAPEHRVLRGLRLPGDLSGHCSWLDPGRSPRRGRRVGV